MERQGRLERLAPLTGILAVALVIAGILIFPEEIPDPDEGVGKIVDFWRDHDDEASVSAVVFALSAVPLLWFAGSLRSALRAAEGGAGRLSSIAFAGLVVFAVGIATGAALQFGLSEGADDLSPAAIEALNSLNVNYFFPYLVGVATFLLATGVAVLRSRALHPAFGWTALIIGIVAVTPAGFFGFVASGLWIIAASIVLFLRGNREARETPPPATSTPA